MREVKLSIIIVNYNTASHTLNCIKSLMQNEDLSYYEIIVVDNNSSEDDLLMLRNHASGFNLIELDKNYGFGYACNKGAKLSKGKFVLFLNPDILLFDSSVRKLLVYAVSNEVLCVTGLLISEDYKIQYCYNYFPGIKWEFLEAFGLGRRKFIESLLARQEIKNNLPFEIDWAHGACLLLKRELFDKTRGFDEKIFLYYEDVDLQYRISKLGVRIVCLPDAKFIHLERSSVRDENGLSVYYKNMHFHKLYYYTKNKGFFFALLVRLLFLTGFILKLIVLPFKQEKFNSGVKHIAAIYLKVINIYLFVWRVL